MSGKQTEHLADAIRLLDEIDGMSFGQVPAALDTMQSHLLLAQSYADKSRATIEALVGALDDLRTRANASYCNYIARMSADTCLGEDAKMASGSFGAVELSAHRQASEFLGEHRGLSEAISTITAALRLARGGA